MKLVETKKSEVRYRTSDPKRMLNRYLTDDLCRTWTEPCIDKETGHGISVERKEKIAYRGERITQELLQRIRFFQAEGGIKEVEVSNQKRVASVLPNERQEIYRAVVAFRDKEFHVTKTPFMLYATSVENAMEILCDYIELHHTDEFRILELKLCESLMLITDDITLHPDATTYSDNRLLEGIISMDEYLQTIGYQVEPADISTPTLRHYHNKALNEKDKPLRKFYQISVRIILGVSEEQTVQEHSFIVDTYTAARASILIKKAIDERLAEKAEKAEKQGFDHAAVPFSVHIEESKMLPVKYFVPREFSEVYMPEQK